MVYAPPLVLPPPEIAPSARARCSLAHVRPEESDERLMEVYLAGDQAAFKRLFQRYAPIILALGRRHLGGEDPAQELVQQTFLRLHGARRDYRRGEPFHPWLMTIVMNLVRDQWRSRKRRPTAPLQHEPAAAPEGATLETRQRVARLYQALARLPSAQREVVELHWFQERPFAEVAQILGASEGAVRVRAHRAYARLKTLLAQERS